MQMCANLDAYFSSVGQHFSSHVGQIFQQFYFGFWSCKLYLVLQNEEHLKATCKSGVGNV